MLHGETRLGTVIIFRAEEGTMGTLRTERDQDISEHRGTGHRPKAFAAWCWALLLAVVPFAAFAQDAAPAKPAEIKGLTYRTIDGKKTIFIVSADELEFREGDQRVICTYTRKDSTLQVVPKPQGAAADLAAEGPFEITPEGLVSQDEEVFCEPATYDKLMAEIAAGGGKREPPAVSINRRYQVIKGRALGGYLAETFPGKRALILLPPEMPGMIGATGEPPYKAQLAGLKRAMTGMEIVAKVEPKMPAEMKARFAKALADAKGGMLMMPEEMRWFSVARLNEELHPYEGKYDILICLTSLPGVEPIPTGMREEPYTKLTCWTDPTIKIALSEGGVARLGKAIADGKICAAVTYGQNIPDDAWDKQPPADLMEAFGKRFVLITPDNIQEHQSYFMR